LPQKFFCFLQDFLTLRRCRKKAAEYIMSLVVEKSTRKIAFMQGKPIRNTYRKVAYQNVSFDMLVEEIAQTQGITKTMAKAVVEAYINRLIHYMELGLGVQMGDFGIFKPAIRTKTTANVENLTTDRITAKRIQFLPGRAFRQMLKNLSIITVGDDDSDTMPASPTPGSGGTTDTTDESDESDEGGSGSTPGSFD